jgi:hypothetical protein
MSAVSQGISRENAEKRFFTSAQSASGGTAPAAESNADLYSPLVSQPFSLRNFADEQVRRLIQRVFYPGWPKPARQVVFAGVDESQTTAAVCAHVVRHMAVQLRGNLCVVDADPETGGSQNTLQELISGTKRDPESGSNGNGRNGNLTFVPWAHVLGTNGSGEGVSIQSRLSELRRSFDYVVVNGPGGGSSLLTLLGQFADGVILIVEAHATRRAAAIQVKERLQAANARLLGVVLAERRFPIPDPIYRRL